MLSKLILIVVIFMPAISHACAVCYGDPESPKSQGMNMGVFTLLGYKVFVLYMIVVSITINPLNNFICNIKISKFKINKSLSAILCLSLFTILTSLIILLTIVVLTFVFSNSVKEIIKIGKNNFIVDIKLS